MKNQKMNRAIELPNGILCGGEEIKPGTLHGGEEIKPGTLHGGEEIKPGTLHATDGKDFETIISGALCTTNYTEGKYRTKDGSELYTFKYVLVNGKIEVDIVSQPSYNGRGSGSHATHRLNSKRGGKKICITPKYAPTNITSAKNISAEWAELTHIYIKTGKTIDAQIAERATNKGGIFSRLFK